ncbi:hypothetical protein [Paracoccus liaowanqingii]|nr:hypothetical protein [Paracoccus liaowanqingii]
MVSQAQDDAVPKIIKQRQGPAIETLAVATESGWLFAADGDGQVFWIPLG